MKTTPLQSVVITATAITTIIFLYALVTIIIVSIPAHHPIHTPILLVHVTIPTTSSFLPLLTPLLSTFPNLKLKLNISPLTVLTNKALLSPALDTPIFPNRTSLTFLLFSRATHPTSSLTNTRKTVSSYQTTKNTKQFPLPSLVLPLRSFTTKPTTSTPPASLPSSPSLRLPREFTTRPRAQTAPSNCGARCST